MSEPFVGEIRMFAGTFAPRGWSFCDGQLLGIAQNTALFSLLGTIYGGDGRTTFGLPDMRGRIPIHAGTGAGLSPRQLGSKSGSENETITINHMPNHTHDVRVSDKPGDGGQPDSRTWAATSHPPDFYSSGQPDTDMANQAILSTGGNQSHTNIMPFQCINFIIALIGLYPSRN